MRECNDSTLIAWDVFSNEIATNLLFTTTFHYFVLAKVNWDDIKVKRSVCIKCPYSYVCVKNVIKSIEAEILEELFIGLVNLAAFCM